MTMGRAPVAVLATMDTKAAEAAFLRSELTAAGQDVVLVDIGLERRDGADVACDAVARAAGHDLGELRGTARRDEAMAAMGAGAAALLAGWQDDGRLAGVIAVGGNQGTSIAATAMRDLPYGLPKLIVSTVASGNVRGFVGDSDITMMFSIGDLLGGPNAVTGPVLRRAAAAVAAMADVPDPAPRPPAGGGIAITAFGNTHPAVCTARELLDAAGLQSVAFHASGACGSAMERLIAAGLFRGVLDLTTHELLGELYPADIYAPVRPGRLTAAGRCGIPQVIAPGGLDYHCFAAADTIPPELADRAVHHHNPNNTNVRASADELTAVARVLAERVNAATAPVAILIPRLGWSQVGSPGGVLHDPDASEAFVATLRAGLSAQVRLTELDVTVNDPQFARAAVAALLDLLEPVGVVDSESKRGQS